MEAFHIFSRHIRTPQDEATSSAVHSTCRAPVGARSRRGAAGVSGCDTATGRPELADCCHSAALLAVLVLQSGRRGELGPRLVTGGLDLPGALLACDATDGREYPISVTSALPDWRQWCEGKDVGLGRP